MISNGIHNNTHEGNKTEELLDLYWYALDESCPLVMVNEHGKITYVNSRFKTLTGFSLTDVQGPLSDLLYTGSHHEGFKEELTELIRSGKTWRRKICLRNLGGQAIGFYATFYPTPGMDPSGHHLLILLPENSKPGEQKETIEPPVRDFSNLAHDLRNPLYNLTALCGLLQDTPLDEKQRDYISKMRQSADQLSAMIEELLHSCVKTTSPVLPVSLPFNVKETIEKFPSFFSQQASSQGITTKLEVDDNLSKEVYGDEKKLNRLVNHITDYLFLRSDLRSLRISALNEPALDDRIEISFFFLGQYSTSAIDTPSPVEAPDHGKNRELELIRSEISNLDGKILLEEENPQAFYFHFTLPFRLSPATEIQAEHESLQEPAPDFPSDAKILVAEDVELNQLVMKHQLQKMGLEADFVRTGFNVLERLRVFAYDLVLMDVQMPGMNGLQTIEAIRSDSSKPYHRIPIIGITASIGGNAREQCLKAGADDFVPKPYNLDDLRTKLKKLITEYRQKKSIDMEKPPKQTDMTPHERCFDLSYLEEISEGDQEFSSTMISYFIDNTPPVMENLEKKVQEEEWEEVRQIAHKLKPQVVYMGIHQIEDEVEKVENFAQHLENLEKIPLLVERIARIIGLAIDQLKDELKNFS
ncbi:MAG: response regulator [Bacteroides sp.]|jgi:CheY-like chemotaxis protein/HPt (histidine-containing phosphotransfer) domain-containing protein|nr:response regulator [Bacteroides sp.]